MTINRNNFEAYLLDYIEGNLDPVYSAELMAFLAENPEFEKYLPENGLKKLDTGNQVFENKNLLKKDFRDIRYVTPANFDEFCIACVEGLLDANQERRLRDFIKMNPEREKDLVTYRNLKLIPDHSVVFEPKNSLKKQGGKIIPARFLYIALSVAAAVLFIIWLIPSEKQNVPLSTQLNEIEILIPQTKSVAVKNYPVTPLVNKNEKIDVQYSAQEIPSTEENSEENKLILASLEPLAGNILGVPEFPLPELSSAPVKRPARNIFNDIVNSENMLQAIVSHIDFWKTAEKAISGINYLTESQLSLTKTTDGLQVNTESYSIEGLKVK